METEVYLFTGLMDSGKTSVILESLRDPEAVGDYNILLIACEDGEVEYEDVDFGDRNVSVLMLESEDELNETFLANCDREMHPEVVFIEYNGMWKMDKLLQMDLPNGWQIVQQLAVVDGSQFENQLNNMRTLVMEQLFSADVVIFNRCDDDTPKGKFRRTVKARNPKAQIVYERKDGRIDDGELDELPYDMNADIIEITDMDYGIFYLDVQDDPKKYEGKKVRFLALVYRPESKFGNRPVFIGGRFAMTCCVEDIQYLGFKCKYKDAPEIGHKSWIWLTAEIKHEFAKEYRGKGPVLYPISIEEAEEPVEQVVYIN